MSTWLLLEFTQVIMLNVPMVDYYRQIPALTAMHGPHSLVGSMIGPPVWVQSGKCTIKMVTQPATRMFP